MATKSAAADVSDRLSDYLEERDGLEMTRTLETEDGLRYRIVRRSTFSASVIVEGLDGLDLTIKSDDGGLQTMQKGIVDTIVGWGKAAWDLGKKLLSGDCYQQNQQVATFDPKTGNMTGFQNTTTIVCNRP